MMEMSDRRYITGIGRSQTLLFPDSLDEYVGEENEVRFIDAFVDNLDLGFLGFSHCEAIETGRHSYDPADMLKLLIYGYLNRIRTSRKLEVECSRNVEVIWLMKKLAPDFWTIADFRKDNVNVIKSVFREFTVVCSRLDLFGRELIGIDGSKFRAVNNRKRNFNSQTVEMNMKRVDERIDGYLRELDESDRNEPNNVEKKTYLREKIEKMKSRREKYEGLKERMSRTGESEISLTDEDSRAMKYGQGIDICYNVQTTVDSKHHIIVDYDVTNVASDMNQLYPMAKSTKDILKADSIEVVADLGYSDSMQINECASDGIIPFIPERKGVRGDSKSIGIPTPDFYAEKFVYDRGSDRYSCPVGNILHFKYWMMKSGRKTGVYKTDSCRSCPHFMKGCTISRNGRTIYRWEHEEVMEELRARMKTVKGRRIMKRRKEIVEHPFGTMKRALNQGYFLLKGLGKVKGETGLTMLAYNMRRAINILGVNALIKAMAPGNSSSGCATAQT